MKTMEPSRTREQGTEVTLPKDGMERIEAIRRIVARHQYAKIDGCMIDGFSASAIVAIYDKLSPENQAKYRDMPADKMGILAFKIINKVL